MDTPTRSSPTAQTKGSRLLLALTLGTWLLAGAGSIWFWFSPSNDLSGLEWLGSPFLGMGILALLMTTYYAVARGTRIEPTVHPVVWSCFAFVATTVNMLTLARFVFGSWKGFQAFPVVIAFELIPIALAVHLSIKEKSRGPMFLILTWAFVLFLVDVTSMGALGMALQPGFWTIGFLVELGLCVLAGSLVIGRSALSARPESRRGGAISVAWRLCVLIGAGLLTARLLLSAQYSYWFVSYAVVAVVVAILVAALRIPAGQRAPAAQPG